MKHIISIANDFSQYPGTRIRGEQANSGEEFRDDILLPALKEAIKNNEKVTVALDGVAGYASSFLEEVFGGLVRHGYSKDDLEKHLVISALSPRFELHKMNIMRYINAANSPRVLNHVYQ